MIRKVDLEMKTILPRILSVVLLLLMARVGVSEGGGFDDYIVQPQYFWPDTNFTFLSHGFPTTPRTQVLANGHLYVAMGAYILIYEIQGDGTLQESGRKMLPYEINSMDHDGDYLYLTGHDGLEIYDGTDYEDPELIGSNSMRFWEWIGNIMVDGDSLYYWWNDSSWGGPWFGIMDVHDRSNPQVAGEYETIRPSSLIVPPEKYENYLLLVRRRFNTDRRDIAILDLEGPSGVPMLIDSIAALPFSQSYRSIEVLENRLYVVGDYELRIFEFSGGSHPETRGIVADEIGLSDFVEVTMEGNRYGYVCSSVGYILKLDLSNLDNPVVVDTIVFPEEIDHDFREIEQYGDFSYAMTSRLNYYVEHPGVHVVNWDSDPNPELIQSVESHKYCLGVAAYDDALYAYTEDGEIVVLDITDRTSPEEIVQDDDELFGWVLRIAGDRLITSEQSTIIKAFGLADPLHPAFQWSYNLPSGRYLTEFYGHESYLIFSFHLGPYTDGGLMIVDMADPVEPRVIYDQMYDYTLGNFTYYHPYLYLINNEQERLQVLDISDIENPVMRTHVSAGSPIVQAGHYGDWLYVNCVYEFQVWDVSDRDRPSRWENYLLPAHIMEISNGILFFNGQRDYETGHGISAWDLRMDPLQPAYCGYYGYNYSRDVNYDLFIVDWPDVIIPGGKYGGVIARFDGRTAVHDEPVQVPTVKSLFSSYPNPFNGKAVIDYSVLAADETRLSIYNLLGQHVVTLLDGPQDAGEYSIIWDASNYPSGVYFARLETGADSKAIKMLLLK
jgi:hypothetical protein